MHPYAKVKQINASCLQQKESKVSNQKFTEYHLNEQKKTIKIIRKEREE